MSGQEIRCTEMNRRLNSSIDSHICSYERRNNYARRKHSAAENFKRKFFFATMGDAARLC